ncbi:MAG: hypothetical protein Q8O13_08270 [Candidatus Omnitrophota bacterium]|nr:hypothetical protein [Candidatus Omnitrophota bacterium]
MPKKKRYFFSVVEEMVMNPKFDGYRVGRIEIYDRKGESREARFLIPEEFMVDFRRLWDSKDVLNAGKVKWATISAYYSMFHCARALLPSGCIEESFCPQESA